MLNYADTAYYTETYKGSVIGADSFDSWARKATLEIRKHTLGNVNDSSIPDDVKMCCCELAECLYKEDQEDTKGVSSEKVGEYSVSYVAPEVKKSMLNDAIREIVYNWLASTGLLYRGC